MYSEKTSAKFLLKFLNEVSSIKELNKYMKFFSKKIIELAVKVQIVKEYVFNLQKMILIRKGGLINSYFLKENQSSATKLRNPTRFKSL